MRDTRIVDQVPVAPVARVVEADRLLLQKLVVAEFDPVALEQVTKVRNRRALASGFRGMREIVNGRIKIYFFS